MQRVQNATTTSFCQSLACSHELNSLPPGHKYLILLTISDVYHVTFDWPTDPIIVDRLVPDPNSTEEVMIKRLMEYHRHSGGILRCYEKVYKVVNCDQPKSDVFSQGI